MQQDDSLGLALIRIGFGLMLLVLTGWAVSGILRKAGYSGWWALLIVVPFGGVIGAIVLAKTTWPVERAAGWRDGQPSEPRDT